MMTSTPYPFINQKNDYVNICPVLGWVLLQQLILITNKRY